MKYTILPSRGIIVFPGQTTIIEVGRKSSLNAIDLAILQNESKIVILSQRKPLQPDVKSPQDLFTVGTLVSVKIEKEFPNGAKTISVFGLKRVRISTIDISDALIEADVFAIREVNKEEKDEQKIVTLISKKLQEMVGTILPMPKDVLSSLATGISASELADLVSHYVPFHFEKKQTILETSNLFLRLKLINELLVAQSQVKEIDHQIDMNVKDTLDSQQREFLLREKLKAIKEELGELSSKDTEIDE